MPMVAMMNERGETAQLAGGVERIYESAVVVILPATVLLACFSDVLMEMLFRRDILDATDAFNILALGSVFTFAAHFNLHVLVGLGAALVANVVLNLALIYTLNIRGAALATALSNGLATLLTLRGLGRLLPLALSPKPFLGGDGAILGVWGSWPGVAIQFCFHTLPSCGECGQFSRALRTGPNDSGVAWLNCVG